jgi:hypothetical protein
VEFEVVRVREPRTGPATAATHRCLWGAFAAGMALVTLTLIGVPYAGVVATAVGLLTLLPRLGPVLGVLLAGVAAALSVPILGVPVAGAVALVGLPARHLPQWWGPLSPGMAAASVAVGGALAAVPGAIGGLVLAAMVAGAYRRFSAHPDGMSRQRGGATTLNA